MLETTQRTYLPAAGHDWSLPLYDPLVKLLGGDDAKRALVDLAAIRPGHRVLDVGCGTGTLLALIKRLHPDADVTGLDPDPKALARARRKAERAAASIRLDRGFADELPYPDASFDRVVSSFVFHHLHGAEKEAMLREVRRVLKSGGTLSLLDFGGAHAGADGHLAHLIPFRRHLKENAEDQVLALMTLAGFDNPRMVGHGALLLGGIRISYFHSTNPHAPSDRGHQ